MKYLLDTQILPPSFCGRRWSERRIQTWPPRHSAAATRSAES